MRLSRVPARVGRGRLRTPVSHVDGFGNCALAASGADLDAAGFMLGEQVRVRVDGELLGPATRAATFGDVPLGALALIVDASGAAALVVNGGDAGQTLGCKAGSAVLIEAVEA